MTYSDFDIGNTWNHAVRKAAYSLFLKWMDADPTLLTGCFLFNSHCSQPSASAHCNMCRKPKSHQWSQKEAENYLILNSGLFCHIAPSCHKENTLANCYIIVGKHRNLLKTFTNETQLLKLNTRCLLQCVALID